MSAPLKILMLEDNPNDAEFLQRWLKREYRPTDIHLSMTEEDFLQSLDSFHPEVILADNSLPQFSATDALRIVRQRKLHTPFIMVTGTISEEFAVNIIKSGADDYILKSSLIRLPSAIEAALQYRKAERDKSNAMRQLIKSEENYRRVVQRITDAFIALDKNWCYTYLNKQAGELIRKDPAAILGKNVWEVFPDAVGSPTYQAFMRAMMEQRYISNVDYYAPLDLWQENHIYPSPDGISVFIRNITEKKKLEQALIDQQRKEQLRLTAAVLDAQEKERNAIAQELHDNVNQILVGVKVMMAVLREKPDTLKQAAEECIHNIGLAIQENRKIAHELVGPDLSGESLLEQLFRLHHDMLEPAGIKMVVQHQDFNESILSKKQRLTVYRIIQEQCTNIIKHARAKKVTVTLLTLAEEFTMQITDDGQGAEAAIIQNGIGLRNIVSRLSVFDGSLDIVTKPGDGFRLTIRMPVGMESLS